MPVLGRRVLKVRGPADGSISAIQMKDALDSDERYNLKYYAHSETSSYCSV